MSIKLKLDGFEDLLKNIEAAGGSIQKATESAVRQSAQIMQSELKAEMQASNVGSDLINAMPNFDIETEGNRITASVGYKKGAYNPDDLSDGYKVVMLNYGTPHRKKHGKIKEGSHMAAGGSLKLGFIQRAKENANKKIKKEQKAALNKILERLTK